MLVLLRIALGWHFLYQGIDKLTDSSFSSKGFLSQAKGPFADHYLALIPDREGLRRLDEKRVGEDWKAHVDKAGQHYRFTDAQRAEAERLLASRIAYLKSFFEENHDNIETYKHELERLKKTAEESPRGLSYQEKRLVDKRKELEAQAKSWIDTIDTQFARLRADIEGLLVDKQQDLGAVPEDPTELQKVDRLVTYSNIAIGLCLIVGLFTRTAALGGALFLLSIVLAQPSWPGIYPPDPPMAGRSLFVNKEVIEMLALGAMATLPVGRWGGLDFIIHYGLVRPLLGRRNTQ